MGVLDLVVRFEIYECLLRFLSLPCSLLIGSAFKDGATRKVISPCEIWSQVYSPNYILPPKSSNPEVMAIDIR
ncbi:hypothetical protein ACSBR1_008720 [Camellia fascicularis]